MKIGDYLKDNLVCIVLYVIMTILIELFLSAFRVQISLSTVIFILLALFGFFVFFYNFVRRKGFYDRFKGSLDNLDQKYLITELFDEPEFLEGKILYQSLYEIDKSMNERIGGYRRNLEDFKEYVELWIHEVKIPIAGILLTLHNHKSEINRKLSEQTLRIENYIEQVLYYVRSENAEKDYLIKECSLESILNNVMLKNKDAFIYYKIGLQMGNMDKKVVIDSKWLTFVVNQIISNSIKYRSKQPVIEIDAGQYNNTIFLKIKDNGIGISESDINRVFDKSFTGENGRRIGSSTGMGLYICKGLCEKLGHRIQIESKKGKYTIVTILFTQGDYYHVLD